MGKTYESRLFINGELVDAKDRKTFTLKSPATGDIVAEVAIASEPEVEAAVAAAEVAQPAWAELPGAERARLLRKWADLIRENVDALNELEALSMGRPIEGNGDPLACASALEYYAALALNVSGHTSLLSPGQLNMTLRQPFGVCAGIIPWNVPGIMFIYKTGSAIAAGNAMIIKTSEKAPLGSLLYAQLSKEAGIPDGIVQVLGGLGNTGKLLAEHMRIRKISFTGSTRTGRLVTAAAAMSNLKNVTLELGGKSPTIVFDDVDIDTVIPQVRFSIVWNSGQICVANSRLYVHEKIYDTFVQKFSKAMSEYKSGDPLDRNTTLGPVADAIQSKAVRSFLDIGNSEGKAVVGGTADEKTNYIPPSVFTGISHDSKLNTDEVFGPVIVVHKFSTEQEAIEKANDTEFGLYAAVFSKDIDRCLRVGKALQSGSVGVNCTGPTVAFDMPFGGYKASGIGRENGPNGLDAYLEVKSMFIKIAAA